MMKGEAFISMSLGGFTVPEDLPSPNYLPYLVVPSLFTPLTKNA